MLALLVSPHLVKFLPSALSYSTADEFQDEGCHGYNATDDQCDFHMATGSLLGKSLNTLNTSSLSGKTITQAVRKMRMKSIQKPMCF